MLSDQRIRRAYKALCREADVPEARFHDLRHVAGSKLVEQNGLVVATKILGHQSPQTTMMYDVHPDEENKRSAIEKSLGNLVA